MAKRIRLSSDGGTVFYTLPGNSGELRNEAGEIVDTVFGQEFQSTQPGLIGWSITSNALYKGFAGYVATIKRVGTSTAIVGGGMTLVTGKTYRITNAAHTIWDRNATLTVKDNAVTVAASNIESIDFLYGRVTFAAAYTVTGPVTVDFNYFPTTALCGANTFTLTQTAEAVDTTDMCLAQGNGGYRVFEYGLKSVGLEMSGFYNLAAGYLALLQSRAELIIEINPDGSNESVCRGFFRCTSEGLSGAVGNPEEESVSFALAVPDEELLYKPFRWSHTTTTTLNQAIRIALDAWETSDTIDAQYLPNGTTGVEGQVIVTEVSLTGGLEAMNEFSVQLQGLGILSTV